MKFIKHLLLSLILVVITISANASEKLSEKVIGMWAEIHPRDNIVYFAKDGSWKLYLTKGEIGDLRSLGGKWSFTKQGKLKVEVTVNGKVQPHEVGVTFDGEEMVFSESDGKETRHRRHKGPLPERFQW